MSLGDSPHPGGLAAIERALGPGGVLLPDRDDVHRYEVDVRGMVGHAAVVLRPSCTDEVRTVLTWALEQGVQLVPQGANTGVVGASVPDGSRRQGVLSLERLRWPLDVQADERTVVAGSGLRLSEVNDAAREHGLHLGIDVGSDPSVGGMVSTNTGGSRLIRYGDVRRHLLGLEVVLPRPGAPVLSQLRTLRKDNSGLDLKQLFVGTGGSFGVVTAAAFSLDRVPDQVVTALLVPRDMRAAMTALARIEAAAGEMLSAFEFMSGPALAAVRTFGPPRLRWPFGTAGPPPLSVLVELSSRGQGAGSAARQDLQQLLVESVSTLLEMGELRDAVQGSPDKLWPLRHEMIDALRRGGVVVGHDVSVPRRRLAAFHAAVSELVKVEAPGWTLADFGHLGDGGLHVVLWWPADRGPAPPLPPALRQALYDLVAANDGSFSAEHGIGPANIERYRHYVAGEVQELTRAIKTMTDPGGVLVGSGLGCSEPAGIPG